MKMQFQASLKRTATGAQSGDGVRLRRRLAISIVLVAVVLITVFFLTRKRATRTVRWSPPAATFVKTDATTRGTWKGVYGANGFAIANDATRFPDYAEIVLPSQNVSTWVGSTTVVRALQKQAAGDRIASCWWGWSSFSIDLNLTDGEPHEVALYFLDWDSTTRSQIVEVLDPVTSKVLDSRRISNFTDGEYLVWNMTGHVSIRLARVEGANAVLSGLFLK